MDAKEYLDAAASQRNEEVAVALIRRIISIKSVRFKLKLYLIA